MAGVWAYVCVVVLAHNDKGLPKQSETKTLDNSQRTFIANNGEVERISGTWLDKAKCCQHGLSR